MPQFFVANVFVAYEQLDAIFCANSTSSVGAFALAPRPDVAGAGGLISPEISTFVPTNGEN